jgi:hypothetical protein
MALRPGIATGLPFRGCKAAGRAGMPRKSDYLAGNPATFRKTRNTPAERNSGRKSQNSYPNETYVRFRRRQVLSLREYAAIWRNLRALTVLS